MILDHVGIGVRSIEETVRRLEGLLGYRQVTEVVVNTRQKVKVTFLENPSIDAKLVWLRELGVRVLTEPQPGEAFEDENIAFLYAGDGLNLELIDTERRARRR